jgi:anti-sigma factor RsiW
VSRADELLDRQFLVETARAGIAHLSDLVGGDALNDITCGSGVELLMEYLEGVLTPEVNAALEADVAACERCSAFVGSYPETPRILCTATAVALPADIQQSLRAFLRRQQR